MPSFVKYFLYDPPTPLIFYPCPSVPPTFCFNSITYIPFKQIICNLHTRSGTKKRMSCSSVIRKEEMIMGHCGPIIATFNGPFQCSLCKSKYFMGLLIFVWGIYTELQNCMHQMAHGPCLSQSLHVQFLTSPLFLFWSYCPCLFYLW